MKPAIIFDLGKVLVDFDYSIAASRLAAQSSAPPAKIKNFIDQSALLIRYETGLLTRAEFFEEVRQLSGFRGSMEEFSRFFADVFLPIQPMIELHAELREREIPAYIFSNTNDLAIEHIRRNFPFFHDFDGYIFSYEVGAMKPDAKIYGAVEKMSGKYAGEIIYIDDRQENVDAGKTRGWRTILHETPEKTRITLKKLLPL